MRRTIIALCALALSPSCFAMPEIYGFMGPGRERFQGFDVVAAAARDKALQFDGLTFESEKNHFSIDRQNDEVWSTGFGTRFNRFVAVELALTPGIQTDRYFNLTARDSNGGALDVGTSVSLKIPFTVSVLLNGHVPISSRWGVFASVGAQHSQASVQVDLCGVTCKTVVNANNTVSVTGGESFSFHTQSTKAMFGAGIDWTAHATPMVVRLGYSRVSGGLPLESGTPSTITRSTISLQAVFTLNPER